VGHQIVYCSRCQTRILGTELEQGKAFAFGNHFCCKACVQPLLDTLPPGERETLLAAVQNPGAKRNTSTQIPVVRDSKRTTTTRIPVVRDLPSSSTRLRIDAGPGTTRRVAVENQGNPFVWIGAGLAVAAVAAVVLLVRPASPPPAAPTPPAEIVRPGPGPAPASSGDASVLAARDYARRSPQDLDGQIQRWQQAVFACENTGAIEEAKRGLADALARRKEAVAAQLADLDRRTKALLEKEGFGGSLTLLESARRRFEGPEWTLEIEKRIREIRVALDARLAAVREEARAAREKKDAARLKAIGDRVAAWGMPEYAASLQPLLALAPEPPAPPPETPKSSPSVAAWEKAMGLAVRRDYAGAATALGGLDATLRAELADDAELLKRAGQVPEEARESIARWTKGLKSVEILDPAGKPSRIEAPFQRVEGARLLFAQGEETFFVESGELAPSTLAALFLGRPKKAEGDERAALLFCLVEGDLDGATKLQGPKVVVPAKYWDWGQKAAVFRTQGREAEARALFAAADEGFEDPPRTVGSVGQFKDLLSKFGDTAFVARNRASITARTAAGRDYLFIPDALLGFGSFHLVKTSKSESAWTCDRDVEAALVAGNYVEFVYSALPDVEYRGWVYAGACCLETFEFGVQATGLRGPDPKNPKETVSAEPGSASQIVPKIPFFMRKAHATHGGPKTASRWDWIPIPLPKSPEGGIKTVRILTAQQGFSVAYAAVSASPDSPRMAETKERERALSSRRLPAPPVAGLLGHWKFDEGQGAVAADASGRGHHAKLVGAAWTDGRTGGGVRFDGVNSYVELPLSPPLDGLQNGDYTLAAWFKPEAAPTGNGSQNDAAHGIVVKQGWHMGIVYGGGQGFYAGHHFANDTSVGAGAATKSSLPGSFAHVAVTFSRKTGQMVFYLNGHPVGAGAGSANVNSRDLSGQPWRFGIGGPGLAEWRWAAKGVLDEVRIYDRALGPAEALALVAARTTAPPPPPAPAADPRPWTPLPLEKFVNSAFRMENGVLVKFGAADDAARSDREFGDVEIRIRFEHTASGFLFFAVRQGAEGSYSVGWGRGSLEKMAGKEHEIVFVCKGDSVTGTLDGQPLELDRRGQPKSGALQFNILEAALRIKSIETREPK
jgi:hypothetical protein